MALKNMAEREKEKEILREIEGQIEIDILKEREGQKEKEERPRERK